MIKYSRSTNGFYPDDFIGKLPEDVVVITKELYHSLLADNSKGKIIISDEKGFPLSHDIQIDTAQEEIKWGERELLRASEELNKVQDGDTSVKGGVSEWRAYRKALRALPTHPEFPQTRARPTAPDKFKE